MKAGGHAISFGPVPTKRLSFLPTFRRTKKRDRVHAISIIGLLHRLVVSAASLSNSKLRPKHEDKGNDGEIELSFSELSLEEMLIDQEILFNELDERGTSCSAIVTEINTMETQLKGNGIMVVPPRPSTLLTIKKTRW